ncbi:MAG TPA: PadR family transcriptional regulator [Caldithrix abyssi]|uniref:PadR family transcriptional regulator n=1 Tax=Caldithrix abyssi TaxID=187145 RepID=A0A7V4TXA7_CALAY|nr:PadR family transcriptional regulator [Caldithrix abyssi]
MTNAEFAILSLVSELPRHGYDIEKIIIERGMRDWTEIGFSSIYYLLNKLEKEGLIISQTEQQPGRGPARKVYYITSFGKETCKKKTLEVLSTPHRCYPPILLGLANLSSIKKTNAINALTKYCDGLSERLQYLRSRREEQSPHPLFVDFMFTYSITMIEAEKKLIESFIQNLEEKNDQD